MDPSKVDGGGVSPSKPEVRGGRWRILFARSQDPWACPGRKEPQDRSGLKSPIMAGAHLSGLPIPSHTPPSCRPGHIAISRPFPVPPDPQLVLDCLASFPLLSVPDRYPAIIPPEIQYSPSIPTHSGLQLRTDLSTLGNHAKLYPSMSQAVSTCLLSPADVSTSVLRGLRLKVWLPFSRLVFHMCLPASLAS